MSYRNNSVAQRLTALLALCVCWAGLSPGVASASVTIAGTRVIFPAQNRETSIRLTNASDVPALVQVWIDRGQAKDKPDTLKVPFTVTPPLARIEPKQGQVLRVIYTGDPLPTDRESIFYFNMLEVPPKLKKSADGGNTLQFAVRTRIKFFYRPDGLKTKPDDAVKQLKWTLVHDGGHVSVKVTNDAPYYVSLGKIEAITAGHAHPADGNGLVPPFGSAQFPLEGLASSTPLGDITIKAQAINDYGAYADIHPKLEQ
ncbi:MAG TPA: fimbria/pilus periplasmic chaperone [Dyella sp.]|uniref:fimbrial biogenesis chaperone n=1 Tax=Dyella sp. TaxID=1869338 RepID=UPI002F957FA2